VKPTTNCGRYGGSLEQTKPSQADLAKDKQRRKRNKKENRPAEDRIPFNYPKQHSRWSTAGIFSHFRSSQVKKLIHEVINLLAAFPCTFPRNFSTF